MDVLRESADVGELVDAAVRSLGPRGDRIAVDVPPALPRLVTDPVLLERALANLVDNSLLHAGGAGLRIEAGAVAVAGRVDIRIIDRGPGIRPADRERIFQPFQRLGDSENRSGVGLGLAVARGFVEAVGGELEVEDTPGGGCTMVVRIPVDQTPDPLASPGGDRGPDPEEAPPRTAEASAP